MVLALLSLAASASAAAAPAAGASNPSVDQYVERVPSAGGDGAPRENPRSGGGEGLSPSVQRQLDQAGRSAEALEAIAGSPALGAPDRPADSGAKPDPAPPEMSSDPSPFDAVTSAATSGDGGASGWLIAGLALLTAALAGTALARKRLLGR